MEVWYRCGQRVRAVSRPQHRGAHPVDAGSAGTVIAGNTQAYSIRFDGQQDGEFVVCMVGEFEDASQPGGA